jgi:hypothetical protein
MQNLVLRAYGSVQLFYRTAGTRTLRALQG